MGEPRYPRTDAGRTLARQSLSKPVTIDQILAIEDQATAPLGEGLDVALMAALADVTAAYHVERNHSGRWTRCQRPRCQNARLATEGRGPFALATDQPASTEAGEDG